MSQKRKVKRRGVKKVLRMPENQPHLVVRDVGDDLERVGEAAGPPAAAIVHALEEAVRKGRRLLRRREREHEREPERERGAAGGIRHERWHDHVSVFCPVLGARLF